MWRDLIRDLDPTAEFHAGANEADLAALETALHVRLSHDLRNLLRESDGVVGKNGPWYVLPAQQIIAENNALRLRTVHNEDDGFGYMPFDHLLFFANAGVDGILFAFPIPAGQALVGRRVFAWYPIEDSRRCVAASLEEYLRRWLSGGLSV
jgi:SMI1/KNR4 family protein SUKH-1